MHRFSACLAIIALSACAADTRKEDVKLDQISAQVMANEHALDTLRDEVHQLRAAPAPPPDTRTDLDRKIDDLNKKIDHLIATAPPPPPPRPARPEADRNKVYAIKVDGYPSDGPADALVTLVLNYDYADPYTEKSRSVIAGLRSRYANDLRVVYRQFVVHPQVATAGALAACAANKQKKFAVLDDALWEKGYKGRNFDTGTCWTDAAGCPVVLGFAKDLGLDTKQLAADMKTCEPLLKADMADLQTFAVAATPTFWINGRILVGAMPSQSFEKLIDEELDKAKASKIARAKYYKQVVLDKGLTKVD